MKAYNISGHGLCASPGAAMIDGKPLLPEIIVDLSECLYKFLYTLTADLNM